MIVYLVERQETEPYENDIIYHVGIYSTRVRAERAAAAHFKENPKSCLKYIEYEIYKFEVDAK
jgi:hypothetical protein